MIIIASFLLIFNLTAGGEARLDELVERVEMHVADVDRSDQVIELIEEVDEILEAYAKQVENVGESIEALHADYHATESQYSTVANQAHQNYKIAADKLLDLRFEIKSYMSREEWIAVFANP